MNLFFIKKIMKFSWSFRYVPEGQIEPDKKNRWRLDCYMYVNIDKDLPEFHNFKELIDSNYIPFKIGSIVQKGCLNSIVPSINDKFCATIISFDYCANLGLINKNFFSNDIDDLKKQVENQFIKTKNIFTNCQ